MFQSRLAKNFKTHIYKKHIRVSAPASSVFQWMLQKNTFTSGQLPPYRVEFLQESPSAEMKVGDQTSHHGPLILFAGELTEITNTYRRLDYYYGSYALSFRWARPACLEVETRSIDSNSSELIITLSTHVHRFFVPIWHFGMRAFWSLFQLSVYFKWKKKS